MPSQGFLVSELDLLYVVKLIDMFTCKSREMDLQIPRHHTTGHKNMRKSNLQEDFSNENDC